MVLAARRFKSCTQRFTLMDLIDISPKRKIQKIPDISIVLTAEDREAFRRFLEELQQRRKLWI